MRNSTSKSSSVLTQESDSYKTYKLPGSSGINQPRLTFLQRTSLFISYIFKITKVSTVEILIDTFMLLAATFIPSEKSLVWELVVLLSAAILYSTYEFHKLKFRTLRLLTIPIYGIFVLGIFG